MKLILIIMLLGLCSCGAKVFKDRDNMWICSRSGFFTEDRFQFKTVKEANAKCTELLDQKK